MMLARRNVSIASEMFIEHFDFLHAIYINKTPSRNAAAGSSANLPAEQADNSILYAVVVRLGNPLIAFVFELE